MEDNQASLFLKNTVTVKNTPPTPTSCPCLCPRSWKQSTSDVVGICPGVMLTTHLSKQWAQWGQAETAKGPTCPVACGPLSPTQCREPGTLNSHRKPRVWRLPVATRMIVSSFLSCSEGHCPQEESGCWHLVLVRKCFTIQGASERPNTDGTVESSRLGIQKGIIKEHLWINKSVAKNNLKPPVVPATAPSWETPRSAVRPIWEAVKLFIGNNKKLIKSNTNNRTLVVLRQVQFVWFKFQYFKVGDVWSGISFIYRSVLPCLLVAD